MPKIDRGKHISIFIEENPVKLGKTRGKGVIFENLFFEEPTTNQYLS